MTRIAYNALAGRTAFVMVIYVTARIKLQSIAPE